MFDYQSVRTIRSAILTALEPISQKNSIAITLNPGSFNSHEIHFKIEIVGNKTGEVPQPKEVREFNQYCNLFGLKPEDLGAVFTWGGKQYKLAGLIMNRPKYPFIAESSSGKRFKFGKEITPFIRNERPNH